MCTSIKTREVEFLAPSCPIRSTNNRLLIQLWKQPSSSSVKMMLLCSDKTKSANDIIQPDAVYTLPAMARDRSPAVDRGRAHAQWKDARPTHAHALFTDASINLESRWRSSHP